MPAGITGLDAILGGGFVEGASYIIQGSPGAGKTILSNQIAFSQVAAGRPVLYVTLLAETHDRLFQSLSTLSFFDKDRLGSTIKYVSVFQCLRDEGLDAVVQLIRAETQRHTARLLVFDGLLNARDRADTELDVKTFVAAIQSQAAFVGCTVLFLTSARVEESSPEHTMVDGVLDLCDEMDGERSYRRLHMRKFRGGAALGGFHQFEISEKGITVFPRLESILAVPSVVDKPSRARLKIGIEALDETAGGGLSEGSVTLLTGPSGSGKTSICLNFLSLATAAQPGLYVCFYETPPRLFVKAAAFGLDMGALVSAGAAAFIWNPLTENILDKLAHELLEAVRQRGVRRLVIDGIGGFERAAISHGRMVEFFTALTNELRALGITTIMTSESRELSGTPAVRPLPDISAILDNLIIIRHQQAEQTTKRIISILKLRDDAFDQANFELRLAKTGISTLPAGITHAGSGS